MAMEGRTIRMGQTSLPAAWVVVAQGLRRGASFSLQAVTNLGRSGLGNEIVIQDPYVSDHHARIRLEGSRYVLYDLGSTNGTRLNGQLISRITLMDGDDITLGTTTLHFKEVRE